jgi:hypothetical protein
VQGIVLVTIKLSGTARILKFRFSDEQIDEIQQPPIMATHLHRTQVIQQKKLDKKRAQIIKEEMKEVTYEPNLNQTERFNMKLSNSLVCFKREKSLQSHRDKIDERKQIQVQMRQQVKDGCTFIPKINKKLKKNMSVLPSSMLEGDQQDGNLFHL